MKQRVITGILIFLICVPFIGFGGHFTSLFIMCISLVATHEAISIKEKKSEPEKYPLYIKIVSYIISMLLIFGIPKIGNFTALSTYSFDYTNAYMPLFGIETIWLVVALLFFLTSCVFDKRFSLLDAAYVFMMVLLTSLGLKGFLYLRGNVNSVSYSGLFVILYVLAVTCLTDIFAYFGGMSCYKLLKGKIHKLNERISPKKTWEGSIIGSVFGIIGGTLIYALLINSYSELHIPVYVIILFTAVLSIAGQFGDLFFSAVKRVYGVKDYSSLLPGHGGILDRIDSLTINCLLTATFLMIVSLM